MPVCWLVTRVMTLTPPFTKYGKYVFEKWILNWCMWKFVPLMKQLLSLRVMWSDVTSTGKRHFRFDHCSIYDMIRDSKRSHIITIIIRCRVVDGARGHDKVNEAWGGAVSHPMYMLMMLSICRPTIEITWLQQGRLLGSQALQSIHPIPFSRALFSHSAHRLLRAVYVACMSKNSSLTVVS